MFEGVEYVFWVGLFGLAAAMSAVGALLCVERQRLVRTARLRRANGTAPSRASSRRLAGQSGRSYWVAKLRGLIVRMGERLAVVLGGEARETARELASAGYRGRDALLIYAFFKTVLPLGAVIVGILTVLVSIPFGAGMMLPIGVVIASALALSKGMDIFVDLRRKSRLARIRKDFPDMLELLVITSEAGLGPQPALHRVAVEMFATHPELSGEVLQMVSEMRMTNERRVAYENFNTRVPLPEIGVFTQTLDQSDSLGTPFSRAMRTLIGEQRSNRLMHIEEKAARLPVLMTLPLIFCIMPAVFVVLVGPAALSVIDNILTGG
ncbi:Bacterial type II secretion system protein F domain protein [Flavimaricola marinus]|uniref:Bacterial type II secretion system protein F domain protein n=2 Tax=Flavimaricola marinus TaxID=1819565 RepID=A0A238LIZ2_9RHOB|nr:Bacterial type II secretion system protein F domain protein [Flavimaricola marinus]